MNECKSCGGELYYDIPSKNLICRHCGSSFSPDTWDADYIAEEATYEVNVFTCPACGGEIASANLSAVEYCPYCGRFSMPASVRRSEKMPDAIMPFEITQEEAKQAFRRYVGKGFYTPSHLKSEEFLSSFRGLFLPYYSYDVTFAKRPHLTLKKEHRDGDYVVADIYDYSGDMDASMKGVAFDASSRFDDTLSRCTLPFETQKIRPFNPSYMMGFYADCADVTPGTYRREAAELASRAVFEKIDAEFPEDSLEFPVNSFESAYTLGANASDPSCVMAPLWFLTWRQKNNVAYAVVNGQTGKTYADLPISIGRFLLGTGLLAIPLFLLFYFLMPTPSIYTMLLFVSIVSVLGLVLYKSGSDEVFILKNHLRDKGYLAKHHGQFRLNRKNELPDLFKALEKAGRSTDYGILMVIAPIAGIILTDIFTDFTRRGARTVGYILMAAVSAYLVYGILSDTDKDKKLAVLADISGSVVALVIALLIHILNPASDAFYYGGAIAVIAGCLWTLLALIRHFNEMATHPDPYFFKDRKGGSAGGEGGSDGGKRSSSAKKSAATILSILLLAVSVSARVHGANAGVLYTNEKTGFTVQLVDDEDLLTDSEEQDLLAAMIPVTEYGHAGFYTGRPAANTESAARDLSKSWFGSKSSTLFLIDMNHRNIWIHSNGNIYSVITKEWADVITDNVYRSASAGDYAGCATEAFSQITTRLQGGQVSSSLRLGTWALIAVLVSMLINYYLILKMRNKRMTPEALAPLMGAAAVFAMAGPKKTLARTTRRYDPPSDSGSSSGGGGFSGGGSSGGGGGHGF